MSQVALSIFGATAVAVFIDSTMSSSDAEMMFDDADESNGFEMICGTVVESLNAASIGSTPFCLSRSHAPGLTVSSAVSK